MANNHLGIPKLLDAEDVDQTRPDEKSILTYVASYYHTFARMKNEQKSGKRIANVSFKMFSKITKSKIKILHFPDRWSIDGFRQEEK